MGTRSALVACLCIAALVVLVAANGPAFSEDRQDEAVTTKLKSPRTDMIDAQLAQPEADAEQPEVRQRAGGDLESDGYEWCASRTTADRYLWSHRPS